jgi:hypothetical protein
VAFNLIFIKKLKYSKKQLLLMACIASPVLLELLLFWNNDSFAKGLKAIEKSTSLVIFPLFIIGNYQRVDFRKIIQVYVISTTVIMIFSLIRFIIVYPDLVAKYLNRIDLWEMGYQFADSIGIHAPALNMHLAFVTICALYFVFESFRNQSKIDFKILSLTIFLVSFFFVLLVNTRMALINTLIGFLIVFFYEIKSKFNLKKIVLTGSVIVVLLGGVLFLFVKKNPYM